MHAKQQRHKARDARLGSVDFADNKLHFLVGYTKCEHCSGRLKILALPDETREIAKTFGYYRRGLKVRLALKLKKWIGDV